MSSKKEHYEHIARTTQLTPSGAKTFGLTRFTVTPKDFAPTRFERDRSGVSILRNTGVISPNRNPAPVTKGWRTQHARCPAFAGLPTLCPG